MFLRDRRTAGILAAGGLLAAMGAADTLSARATADDWSIDTAHSRVTVNVLPAGLLSSALHPHHFEPDEWSGVISRDPGRPGLVKVEVRIAAASLHDHQPRLSAGDVAKVERRVQSAEILDSARYPTILFEATELEAGQLPSDTAGEFRGTLTGSLTLRGKSRPLRFGIEGRLSGERLEARGMAAFRQSEFGIKPYSTGLGTVAVRDEVTVDLALVAIRRGRGAPAR